MRLLVAMILVVSLSACGTIKTIAEDIEPKFGPFSGVRLACSRLRGNECSVIQAWFYDIPFSFVADTALLPISFPNKLLRD